jgi:hypothetical protein
MTVKCPACGTEFENGTMFCDQCGGELPQPEAAVAVAEEVTPEAAPVEEEQVVPAPPLEKPVSLPTAARLIVTRGAQLGVEYPLIAGENEIGRWDEEEGYMPHVDLEAQDTEGYVHRRHAVIRFDGNQWWLEHLKEPPSNPTRIRGRGDRLEAGKPVPLQNGDEIVIGRVILKFVVG